MRRTVTLSAQAALASACLVITHSSSALGQLLFTEIAADVGMTAVHAPGSGFHTSPVPDISFFLSSGAVGDFNNDGWQDLFVIIGGAAPDKLFINNGDGTFTDQAAQWGIGIAHLGIGVAAGDYDRNGWLDLYVTSFGQPVGPPAVGKHRLYRNNGNGTFTEVATVSGVASTGATDGMGPAFGDYDLDGDLDLFIPGWLGGGNRLFRNNGDGTFTQVTAAAGVQASSVFGFSPRF